MNDTLLTICGNVVDEPTRRRTRNGHTVANFRVASTSRKYDREEGRFVDNSTLFVTVSAWRALGENVLASVHRGNPVIVTGRYSQREWKTDDEQLRSTYELEAVSVGHDLSRGTSAFTKTPRRPEAVVVEHDEAGPRDESAHFLDVVPDDVAGVADDAAGALPEREPALAAG